MRLHLLARTQREFRAMGLLPLSLGAILFITACFPGGIHQKGGFVDGIQLFPEATRTGATPYSIVCRDREELKRREDLLAKGEIVPKEPPVRYVIPADYHGGCEEDGESSRFFLLHLWPVTPPIDPAYAMGRPVQELEGDTMINIRSWHETHYYSFLGHARVFHVRGDVIRFNPPEAK